MKQLLIILTILSLALGSCRKSASGPIGTGNVIIINEGQFRNTLTPSISLYDPSTKSVSNNIYSLENNGAHLGDVAQSLYLQHDTAFIVMNNSAKIVVADAANNFKHIADISIPNSSPRFFLPVDGRRAYVTELYGSKIWIIDYKADTFIKSIAVTGWTEQLVSYAGKVYVAEATTPTFGGTPAPTVHAILKIDPTTDQIVGTLPLASDPGSIALTDQNQLFVLAPQQTSPASAASIYNIDMNSFSITRRIDFPASHTPNYIRYSTFSHQLLYEDNNIYAMLTTDTVLPAMPLMTSNGWNVYGLNADPSNGDIYVSDAVDYQQASHIMRFSSTGASIDAFHTGIITNGFVFR